MCDSSCPVITAVDRACDATFSDTRQICLPMLLPEQTETHMFSISLRIYRPAGQYRYQLTFQYSSLV